MTMKWLFLSDIFPVMIFCMDFSSSFSLVCFGAIISRLFSLIFHVFRENRPHLINLDLIGISCMALASPTACESVGCGHCAGYCAALLALFTAFLALSLTELATKTASPRPHTALILLAVLGHYPCAYAIVTSHNKAAQLSVSAALFASGYFIVEPIHHTSWHWMAAAGQWLLLRACA